MPHTSKTSLVILGTSLFAPEVVDLANETGCYEVKAFIENLDIDKTRRPLLDRMVVWIDDAAPLATTHEAVCGLGTTRRKVFIEQAASLGFRFARVIHPDARVSAMSTVGEGSILGAGVIVGACAAIGRHVIVNRGTLIGHHTTVHDYVTLAPGANIAGAVTIGEGAYVAIGAVVVDRVTIGAHAFVSAGSVVMTDVPDHVQVMGNPARIVRTHVDGH